MVLRIKDGVDLTILKKYGYEYFGGVIDTYYKTYFSRFLWFLISFSKTRGISINNKTRIINIKKPFLDDWIQGDDVYAIKDLIEAGLVEKVDEKRFKT